MSRSKNLFEQVPIQQVPRNYFDLSHEVKMSGKFGFLYPVLCMDCLPGDTIRDTMVAQVRFAPMLAPIMHRVDVKVDFFFVPNRLVWSNWEDFITGGQDGLAAPVHPYMRADQLEPLNMWIGTPLWDMLGLPPVKSGVTPAVSTQRFSALPLRAAWKIWNDYYRDPNLDNEVDIHEDVDGNDSTYCNDVLLTNSAMWFRRGWDRDYFTAALPWAQRGAEVLMPLAGTGSTQNWYVPQVGLSGTGGTIPTGAVNVGNVGLQQRLKVPTTGGTDIALGAIPVTLDESSITINDFRRTLAIQSWLENNARGGGRYVEQVMAHFRVRVPDYRLQRAEYLGGGRQAVVISEVRATAQSTDVPVGDLAGHGISVGRSNRFTYRCQEHGFVIGIMSVTPRTAYMDGIPKMFTRFDKFDYAFPEMANLGEQEIVNREVYWDSTEDTLNNQVFGYIPRFAEYKFMQDRVHGEFRDTLLYWHLSRKFIERPVLDENFVRMIEDGNDPSTGDPMEESYRRIFAVEDGTDYLWIQLFHNLSAKRPLPYFGVPQLKG